MKYRIVEVSPPGVGDVYYEVEQEEAIFQGASMKRWEFVAKFNTIDSCKRYIDGRVQPTRKVISEIEV